MDESDVCCLVDPSALDPEVRTLGDHLSLNQGRIVGTLQGLFDGLTCC
jgi:hypothetical protein